MFVNINKQGSTVQNSTRKHTKHDEKVKLDKEAHQAASQNFFRYKARAWWKLRHSPWIISPLKNFWGAAKFVTVNTPQKFQECWFRLHYERVLWRTQKASYKVYCLLHCTCYYSKKPNMRCEMFFFSTGYSFMLLNNSKLPQEKFTETFLLR